MNRFSPVVERALAAAALLGTFVVTASIVQPHLSSASHAPDSPRPAVRDATYQDETTVSQNQAAMPAGPQVRRELHNLGDLIGRTYVVRIYMYGDLPLFSVFNHDGSVVAEMVREIELKQLVDDPDLHSNIAGFIDENTTMLSAEPATDRPGE